MEHNTRFRQLTSVLQRKLLQRIANLRTTRSLTQEQLAEAVGCSVEFISLVSEAGYSVLIVSCHPLSSLPYHPLDRGEREDEGQSTYLDSARDSYDSGLHVRIAQPFVL